MKPKIAGLLEVRTKSWEDARHFGKRFPRGFFRGQKDRSWPLRSTLERAALSSDLPLAELSLPECLMVQDFVRHAGIHSHAPKGILDTLALLQHHGCPTRLLDFTRSFYVAAFFAVDDATTDSAVWAIYDWALSRNAAERLGTTPDELSGLNAAKLFEQVFFSNEKSVVALPLEPSEITPRSSSSTERVHRVYGRSSGVG
jgi:hypothetical protein